MWICPYCNRQFKKNNQVHYCGDKAISDFLVGKTDIAVELFDHLISKFNEIGLVNIYATKSMIVIVRETRFAYVINLGKTFIDVVLPFKESYDNNLCFRKIALVPGSNDYNHHLRIMHTADFNEEVFGYLKKAYENGKDI